MKPNKHPIIAIVSYLCAVFSSIASAEDTQKIVKTFTIKATANASPVGGQMKGTGETITENFRVSSGNIILPESLVVTTIEAGRSGSCSYKTIKEAVHEVNAVAGAAPIKMTFPIEIQLVAYASSPGCTLLEPGCVGRSSTRRCQLTGKYTD